MMVLYLLLIILVTVSMNIHLVNLLRITNFHVPLKASNQVDIDCKYDIEGEKLYDVKWYKDDQQFYKCAADGTVKEHPVEGVMIRHPEYASVGACPITLIALTAKSAGIYKCEITLDKPGFPIFPVESRLDLFLPPKQHDDHTVILKGSARRTSEEEMDMLSGSERHTSTEEENTTSGGKHISNNYIIILLLVIYFILK